MNTERNKSKTDKKKIAMMACFCRMTDRLFGSFEIII